MGKAGSKRLEFTTIFNVRDLCGYKTPSGTVLPHRYMRSGDTMFLSDEERQALLDYGVRRVVDLRMAIERPDLSNRLAHVDGVAWINSSMADDRTMTPEWMQQGTVVGFVVEGYQRMLSDKEGVKTIFEFMAEAKPNECVLFHCAGGMDRTGLVSSLILGCAGVARDHIVADYAYSFGEDEEVDELLTNWDLSAPYCPHDGVKARISAMYELLDWIQRDYGTTRNLLLDCGVSNDAIDALVAHAVE